MAINLIKTQIGRLRILAFSEDVSYLLLFAVTMPLKYIMGMGGPNMVVGMIHGFLFIAYIAAVIKIKFDHNWSYKKTFLALLASVIPFGTFWADWKLFR